ncbi:MAG: hypothetical protein AMJ56_21825 [Anaerolineae bacterium SG8_19]|jgi:MGT family glycosyltransferase|nr:MAG: hypothetical protein AMJ56_21825 [Anaerolineae bacterium SG8_19]HCB50639.1 glycosyl transferase, UDP-glucuronosyltransferase [Chloroflexota bacterium]
MVRYLFLTAPATGHLFPSLAIAQELIERDHQVAWITGRAFQNKIEDTGAQFIPLPAEIDASVVDAYDLYPELKKLKGFAQFKYYLKHVFLDTCPISILVIDRVLADFPADVFVGDTVMYAPFFKAEMVKKPSAMVSLLPLGIPSRDTPPFGLGIQPGNSFFTRSRDRLLSIIAYHILLRDVNQYANKIRQELGLKPLKKPFLIDGWYIPTLVMQLSTIAFEYPRSDLPEHITYIGPVLVEPSPEFLPPIWWSDLTQYETVILVNQGTVAMDLEDLIIPTISGLRDQQLLIVAVPVKEGDLHDIPANVRAEPFIPFAHLLPHVDVMVTNGGYGGTQLALAHGVPLVVAGDTDDKMEVAARVEWSGAGINLKKQRPTSMEVRDAVMEVMNRPSYRQNAKRIQADFARYDAPILAADLLEALAIDRLNRSPKLTA